MRRTIPQVGNVAGVATSIPYTPTVTQAGNTFGGITAAYQLLPGGLCCIWGQFTANATVASAVITISLPTGVVPFPPSNIGAGFGCGTLGNSTGTQTSVLAVAGSSQTTVRSQIATTSANIYFFFGLFPVAGS